MAVTLIRVSDVVNELSVAQRDNNRDNWLRSMILAKSILRDLKVKYLNDFKRVYLAVDKATNTVRLPLDFYRFRTISVIQTCLDAWGNKSQKVLPLTYNPYINITPVTTPDDSCSNPKNKPCGCETSSPVCTELSNYTSLCETIVVSESPLIEGVKQTVLRTCANGDIVKEVCQPTQKFIEGDLTCDYEMVVDTSHDVTTCVYQFNMECPSFVGDSITLEFVINGVTVTSPELTTDPEVVSYMESLGWIQILTCGFLIETTDVYESTFIEHLVNDPENPIIVDILSDCSTASASFPYTILNYTINDTTTDSGVTITDQDSQDTFFLGLGFTKTSDTTYTLTDSTDVYFNIVITYDTSASPPITTQINFNQSSCHRPLVDNGIENLCTTDVLCNVKLKDCGCIVESQSNIDTIVSCCGSFLNCCQTGELTNWKGWGVKPCCPTNTEQPYNVKGTYRIDEKNLLIYLDSVNASQLLLAYDTDGSCEGEYVIPDYTVDSFKAGIAYYSAEFDDEVTDARRASLLRGYNRRLMEMSKLYIDPIRMSDLLGVLIHNNIKY